MAESASLSAYVNEAQRRESFFGVTLSPCRIHPISAGSAPKQSFDLNFPRDNPHHANQLPPDWSLDFHGARMR